jgi:hypothetical protein
MYALESLHYRVTEQLTHRFVHSFCGNVACGGENNTNLPMIYRRCQPGLAGLCSLRGRRIWCRLPSPRRRRQSEIYYRPNRLDRNSERVELVQNRPAVFVDAVFVYRCRDDSPHHHEPTVVIELLRIQFRSARATDPTPFTRIKTPDPKYLDLLPKSDPLNICRCESLLD